MFTNIGPYSLRVHPCYPWPNKDNNEFEKLTNGVILPSIFFPVGNGRKNNSEFK